MRGPPRAGGGDATRRGPGGGGLLEQVGLLLARSVDPYTRVETRWLGEGEMARELLRPGGAPMLGVGIAASVYRRRQGLDLLAIPGWRLRLGAVAVSPVSGAGAVPTWDEVIGLSPRPDCDLVVEADHVGEHYLLARPPAAVDAGRLVRGGDRGALAEALRREACARPHRWLVLVAEAACCGRVAAELLRGEPRWREGERQVVMLAGAGSCATPAYDVAVAWPARRDGWRPLLAAALTDELLGVRRRQPARLYAEAAAARWLATPGQDPLAPAIFRGNAELTAFPGAGVDFQEELCRHLVTILAAELDGIGARRGRHGANAAAAARALALEHAAHLLPEAWRATLAGVMPPVAGAPGRRGVTVSPPATALYCQSCSVSLAEERNRGASDRFCRYCADERGVLRPRGEVQRLIADWFGEWQGELSAGEAMRRAAAFMRAMPAWSDN